MIVTCCGLHDGQDHDGIETGHSRDDGKRQRQRESLRHRFDQHLGPVVELALGAPAVEVHCALDQRHERDQCKCVLRFPDCKETCGIGRHEVEHQCQQDTAQQ